MLHHLSLQYSTSYLQTATWHELNSCILSLREYPIWLQHVTAASINSELPQNLPVFSKDRMERKTQYIYGRHPRNTRCFRKYMSSVFTIDISAYDANIFPLNTANTSDFLYLSLMFASFLFSVLVTVLLPISSVWGMLGNCTIFYMVLGGQWTCSLTIFIRLTGNIHD